MERLFAFTLCVLALAGIALVAASLGTQVWGNIKIGRENENCTVTRTLGLFLTDDVVSLALVCGNDRTYATLTDSEALKINLGLIYTQIAVCCATIFFGLIAGGIAGYNLCFRPYESWAGSYGLIAYFSIASVFNLVSVILFVVSGFTDLSDTIPEECAAVDARTYPCKVEGYEQSTFIFGYSFYLTVAAFAPLLLGIVGVIVGDKTLSKRVKNKFCPSSLEEPEMDQVKDNNIMMF